MIYFAPISDPSHTLVLSERVGPQAELVVIVSAGRQIPLPQKPAPKHGPSDVIVDLRRPEEKIQSSKERADRTYRELEDRLRRR